MRHKLHSILYWHWSSFIAKHYLWLGKCIVFYPRKESEGYGVSFSFQCLILSGWICQHPWQPGYLWWNTVWLSGDSNNTLHKMYVFLTGSFKKDFKPLLLSSGNFYPLKTIVEWKPEFGILFWLRGLTRRRRCSSHRVSLTLRPVGILSTLCTVPSSRT